MVVSMPSSIRPARARGNAPTLSRTTTSMNDLFDTTLHQHFQHRHAAHMPHASFLAAFAVDDMMDRLHSITKPLARVALIGGHTPALCHQLMQALPHANWLHIDTHHGTRPHRICTPDVLGLERNSLDAVVVIGALHWANDMVGALIQARLALVDDGVLLATLPGARTLHELREVMTAHAAEHGMAPHLIPLMDVRDAGNLLQRAGYALPVVDSERLEASYESAHALWRDLRHMGEANVLLRRSKTPRTRSYWHQLAQAYHARFADAEGRIPATFEMLTLTAWKPHESQPKPAKRGSGTIALGEALNS
jgi:SAM-dependent methyltransferase